MAARSSESLTDHARRRKIRFSSQSVGKAMRAPRTTGQPAQDEDIRRREPVLDEVRVELQPVVGTVSAPIFDEAGPLPDELDPDSREPLLSAIPAADPPWPGLRRPVGLAGLALPLAVATAIALVTSDARLGVEGGLFVWLAGSIGSVSGRVPFSFGEGFVGYRPDPVWPHGVQEDDDVRWDWRIHRDPPDEVTDAVTVSIR